MTNVTSFFTPTPHKDVPTWVNDYFRQIKEELLILTQGFGYGGIQDVSAGTVALSDINATPQVIPATGTSVDIPKNMVQDVANDGISFNEPGIWRIDVIIDLTFVGVNNPRTFNLELYDLNKAAIAVSTPIAIGRNQEGANGSTGLLSQVFSTGLGGLFQIRLSSTADTFTTVLLNSYSFSAVQLDRFSPFEQEPI